MFRTRPHYYYPAPTISQPATFTPDPPSPTIEAPRTPTPPLLPPSPSPQKNEPSHYASEVNAPDTGTTTKTRATSKSGGKSPSEIWYDLFEAALFSISDSQLLLSAALVINFANTGLCTTSRYHFNIAPFTAFVRVAVLLFLIGLLLLPAACFIDKNLHNETFSQLLGDQARLDAVGARQTVYERWETALWASIIPAAVMCIPVSCYQIIYNLKHNANTADKVWPGKLGGKRRMWAVMFYWSATWIAGVVCLGWVIHYIVDVKAWVHASGWMCEEGVYAEEFVRGMGQIAPIVAVGAVALASLEKWVWPIPR
ncbi:hypothetical protein QBC40DRAFT_308874 [Triangularia verruculosa]|uniref:Uncharacterized protein n=1 Tax=Triangularia verruculosa TaxID=2587418 RepID=A0AAN7AU62_9PEZI|nr:hypothetical protein QBC40DRAFT_308874 [Triangularia verruculosa]